MTDKVQEEEKSYKMLQPRGLEPIPAEEMQMILGKLNVMLLLI